MDLKGTTLQLEPNEVLRFKGCGRICNGTIIGNNSSIEARIAQKEVIINVTLDGTWRGKISDRVFKYKKRRVGITR